MRPAQRADVRSLIAPAVRSAVVTTVAVAGSVTIIFFAASRLAGMGFFVPGTPWRPLPWWFIALGVATVLMPPFVGGGLWGWGMARIFGRPVRPAIRTGALAFGGMVFLTAVPTDLSQLWLNDLPAWMPFDVHGYFTIVFMLEVAVVASVAGWLLARHLGANRAAVRVGVWTGVAAAIGFFLGSWFAVGVGFRIRPWVRFSMVWAFLVANPVAALAAGASLGWQLSVLLKPYGTGGDGSLGASVSSVE